MSENKKTTIAQDEIVSEFVNLHGLDESQISFDGQDPKPIFDYEAVCALTLKLTDIQDIECSITERNFDDSVVSAQCKVTLPSGKTRTSEDSASIGEAFGKNKTIDSMRLAELVAQSRSVRRGVRSVGINLLRAHEQWKSNGGKAVEAHVENDPRQPQYQELHVLAAKIGYIVGSDKTKHQQFIAENFEGRSSSKDLNDIELQRLLITYRAMARLNPSAATAEKVSA